jgi:hypothetical protein
MTYIRAYFLLLSHVLAHVVVAAAVWGLPYAAVTLAYMLWRL